MTALAVLKGLWRLLSFSISIPLWVFPAAWLVMQLDALADQRAAVKAAVADLVDGAELAAAQEKIRALDVLTAAEAARAMAADEALRRFEARQTETDMRLENANDQIAELLARPVPASCTVDADLLDRLRSR